MKKTWSSATPTHLWAGRLSLQPNPTLPSGPHHCRDWSCSHIRGWCPGASILGHHVSPLPASALHSYTLSLTWPGGCRPGCITTTWTQTPFCLFVCLFFWYRPNISCKWPKPSSQLSVTQMCFLPDPPSGSGPAPPTRHPSPPTAKSPVTPPLRRKPSLCTSPRPHDYHPAPQRLPSLGAPNEMILLGVN